MSSEEKGAEMLGQFVRLNKLFYFSFPNFFLFLLIKASSDCLQGRSLWISLVADLWPRREIGKIERKVFFLEWPLDRVLCTLYHERNDVL